MNNSILLYIFLTARRDWLYAGIYLLLFFVILLAVFFGSTTLVEQNLTTAVFIGGATRIVIIFGLALFTCFHVKRGFENKEIDMFLTKPINRIQFVLYYFSGLAFLSFSIILPLVFILLLFLKVGLLWGSINGFMLWGLSLFLESLIIIAFALFTCLTLDSAICSILVCFAFYTFSRIFGFFLITINNPYAVGITGHLGFVYKKLLWGIGMLMPRLDKFSNSEWLIYGVGSIKEFATFNFSSLIYTSLLLCMAIYDFRRRQF